MVTEAELLAAVDWSFEVTAGGRVPWPDPHAGRSPREEEYSRVTDPDKWRIVGARAEAWLLAVADTGLATVEPDAAVTWAKAPGTVISRADRIVPHAAGALPVVIARSRIDDADDAGVTLGVDDPAVCVMWIPDCGCDACDCGAQPELDLLDAFALGVVQGAYRRLSNGGREILAFGERWWSATGIPPDDVPAVLAEPSTWDEVSGVSWLGNP